MFGYLSILGNIQNIIIHAKIYNFVPSANFQIADGILILFAAYKASLKLLNFSEFLEHIFNK